MAFEVVTRAEALAKGLAYFWSNTPCRRFGHVGFRRVRSYSCYECDKQHNRNWHSSHPDLALARQRRFHKENPSYTKEYRKQNPEVHKAATRRYREKFPEKHVALNGAYQRRNRDKIQAYRKNKRQKYPAFAIRANLASRLAMAIRNAVGNKSAGTMELVGCSIEHLMGYLEHKFTPGMTWDNYGLGQECWHCDHIRPCAAFDLTKPEQQRACFHFTNLQPLWQPDNFRKGAKLVDAHPPAL